MLERYFIVKGVIIGITKLKKLLTYCDGAI